MPPRILASRFIYMYMHVAPFSDCSLLNLSVPFKVIQRGLRLFSDVWSENHAALFKKIDENLFKSTNTIKWF